MNVPDEVAAVFKSYVYVYIDPRDGRPFYVGKGTGDRLFAHLRHPNSTDGGVESEKVRRIDDLHRAGLEPEIDLLCYGLSDAQAALVEAAAIDLIGRPPLTNAIAGIYPEGYGRINSEEAIAIWTATPVTVREPAILITINRLYRSDMTAEELYEATRGIWVIGPRRDKAELALAVYQGIVREVYRIERWYPAGTLEYRTRPDLSAASSPGRWEFTGHVAEDVRDSYVGHSVGKGGQNPIRYVNL